jgi:ribonuclease Y
MNNPILWYLIIGLACLAAGSLAGYLLRKNLAESRLASAEAMAKKIVEDAEKEAETKKKEALLETKDNFYRAKAEFEKETRQKRQDIQVLEKRLIQKEEAIDRKSESLDRKENDHSEKEKGLAVREEELKGRETAYQHLLDEEIQKLERISGMTSDQAKKYLMETMKNDARIEGAKYIKKIEEDTLSMADKKSKEIISTAIQRCASEFVAEATVSVVTLPNEEMKGRIIGREGRNIRALESATGVDLIIDDTPEAVILSAFDPIRRQVAKISLERLISDGRIHPARIEEVVEKVQKELEQNIKEAGEQATFDLGVHNVHPEEIKLLGRLKYRTSYGQNTLAHSIEVAHLCGLMASELGINVKMAKRAGLLHDIGKAIDHETEGSHAAIGAEIARRYQEPKEVINAIFSHHEEEPPQCIEAVLVAAADALSAARPGARREVLEAYVKRMEALEDIATSFPGIQKAYAIQAGREVRIVVHEAQVSDADLVFLSRDIARKIETELAYPGQIKVMVIRETRAVDYAK